VPYLFISRSLEADSPIQKWAKKRGIEVIDKPLLRFSALPFNLPKGSIDWIFFYSPRAVEFFWTPIAIGQGSHRARKAKLAAIGAGTARALSSRGYKVDFTGTGHPTTTAEAFVQVAKGQSVLFPRADKSRRSIELAISDRIRAINVVVYENRTVPPVHPIGADVVVLTSPMNVLAWFTTHEEAAPNQQFVAIGPSTAAELRRFGIEPRVAAEPSETGILEVIRNLL